jgi:hypothetical protein
MHSFGLLKTRFLPIVVDKRSYLYMGYYLLLHWDDNYTRLTFGNFHPRVNNNLRICSLINILLTNHELKNLLLKIVNQHVIIPINAISVLLLNSNK